MSSRQWFALVLALIGGLVLLGHFTFKPCEFCVTWDMVHVSGEGQSGDAHLIRFPDGHVVLIDTGFRNYAEADLLPFLQQHGVGRIDQVIVTHAHRNHYGGVVPIIKSLGQVGTVHFNVPDRAACDAETWATGCNYQHVIDTRSMIEALGVPVHEMNAGQTLYQNDEGTITLRVLYAYDGANSPVGQTDINDTSAILRLDIGAQSVLFTGDLNHRLGRYLSRRGHELQATIMTAPHHGVESAAPNDFFDKVNPRMAMVSVSAPVWQGSRGARMREYFTRHEIPYYVTGIHGNVTVHFSDQAYRVSPQRPTAAEQ
jgi:competence protein ComEC